MDINEIARRAGVSRATVSRYLNDGYVSAAKRDAIARVIDETGYVPSRQARQLRTGRTGLVGVIIPKINSQSVSRMVSGITEVLSESDYQILLADTNNDTATEVEYLHVFAEKNHVDGIVFIAIAFTEEHEKAIKSLNTPIVVLGQKVEGYDCVYHEDRRASFDVARIALATARHVAYIGVFDEDQAVGEMRRLGFLDACAEAGVQPNPDLILTGDFTMDSGYFCCEQILDLDPKVDYIACATDTIAFGALTCLREYGRRVPDDVQVTGIGDSEFSRAVSPSLTTAHLHYETSGVKAARILLTSMSATDETSQAVGQLKMSYEVYARTSTR